MKTNRIILIGLCSLSTFSLFSQSIYSGTEMNFYGRWIEWADGEIYPKTNLSIQISDPINEATGFWDRSFTIPLYYTDDIAAEGWVPDFHEAVAAWNGGSNLANLSAEALQGNTRTYDFTNGYNRKNVIFLTDDPLLLNLEDDLAATYPLTFYDDLEDCTSGNWQLGPLILEVDVGFNDTKDWYTGINSTSTTNTEYSVYKLLLHELGHVFGLDHWPYKKDNRIIMHSHTNSDNGRLQVEDYGAINELYGKDGLNSGGTDPFYSNIPCDYFTFGGVSSHKLTARSGEPMVFSSSNPCDNCFRDPYEDGINCGVNSGCGVLCEDICSYTGSDLVFIDYEVPIYTYTIAMNTIEFLSSDGDINFDGDYKYIKAGDYIDVHPNSYFFDTGVESEVEFVIGDCSCADICDPYLPNVMTPNCDGINDWLRFYVNGADFYDFTVEDRNGTEVYSSSGPIEENPIVFWGGVTNAGTMVANATYFYELTLSSSCSNQDKSFSSQLAVLDPNPCMINLEPKAYTEHHIASEESGKMGANFNFNVFPNPFMESVVIKSGEGIMSYRVSLPDGRTLLKDDYNNKGRENVRINTSNLAPGAYVLEVITASNSFTRTIIKADAS